MIITVNRTYASWRLHIWVAALFSERLLHSHLISIMDSFKRFIHNLIIGLREILL